MASTLFVTKATTLAEHTVAKSLDISGNTQLNGNTYITGYLDVTGSATVDNTLYVKEVLTANKNVAVMRKSNSYR